MIRKPVYQPIDIHYDRDCQEALAEHLDRLLDDAQAAGWDRSKAASALMYLGAKRLRQETH